MLREAVPPLRVQLDENEQQKGETPKAGSAVAKKGKRNANSGQKANGHPYVDGEVHKEYYGDTVAVDSSESVFLLLGKKDDTGDQCGKGKKK